MLFKIYLFINIKLQTTFWRSSRGSRGLGGRQTGRGEPQLQFGVLFVGNGGNHAPIFSLFLFYFLTCSVFSSFWGCLGTRFTQEAGKILSRYIPLDPQEMVYVALQESWKGDEPEPKPRTTSPSHPPNLNLPTQGSRTPGELHTPPLGDPKVCIWRVCCQLPG